MTPPTPDEALRRLLLHGHHRAAEAGSSQAALWGALAESTEGGKRFRPALVVAAHDALDGGAPDAAAAVGAAVELLHTAFVIHDDVIDGDYVRRGRLNVRGRYATSAREAGVDVDRARHYGDTAGILAGDLALAGAIRVVATCSSSAETTRRLLDLFDRALHATAAGELADVRFSLGVDEVTLTDVLTMEEQKTSAYSFELPLQSGAILAGAPPAVVDRLGQAGRLLGLAFQLVDDLLGVFGDPTATGKSALSDLREGKHTALLAHARTTPLWPQVAARVGDRGLDDVGADEVRVLLEQAGSRRFVEELAEGYVDTALRMLEELGLPATFLASVTSLAADPAASAA